MGQGYLRGCKDRHIDVQGKVVRARWRDMGEWQSLTMNAVYWPHCEHGWGYLVMLVLCLACITENASYDAAFAEDKEPGKPLEDGDKIALQALRYFYGASRRACDTVEFVQSPRSI